jgi:hypothetical protein
MGYVEESLFLILASIELSFFLLLALGGLALAGAVAAGGVWWWRRPGPFARVAVTAVYLTAGGSMLDVRYRITRPGRQLAPPGQIALLGPDGQPAAVPAGVARIGRLAPRSALLGAGGFILLRCTRPVARGERVTVVLGPRRFAGIPVS